MIRLSNIRIGTKLAIASGIGILLVAGMTASQIDQQPLGFGSQRGGQQPESAGDGRV